MDLNFSDEDFAFQMEVRNWIKDNYPAEMKARKQRSPGGHLSKEDHVYWQKALNTKGWVAPGWPVEHGGSNFTPSQRYLFDLEMAHADTPAIIPFGLGMVAPVIMKYGTEEQKAKYLPDILDTNVWWCQGILSRARERSSFPSHQSGQAGRSLHRQWHQNLEHHGPVRGHDLLLGANQR